MKRKKQEKNMISIDTSFIICRNYSVVFLTSSFFFCLNFSVFKMYNFHFKSISQSGMITGELTKFKVNTLGTADAVKRSRDEFFGTKKYPLSNETALSKFYCNVFFFLFDFAIGWKEKRKLCSIFHCRQTLKCVFFFLFFWMINSN